MVEYFEMAVSMKFCPPVLGDNYERYKQELEAWRTVTEIPKKKQGIAIALTLPEEHSSGIRGRVFEEIPLTQLNKGTGLDTVIQFMNKHLGKDEITDTYEKFADFEDYQRADQVKISEYVANFHQKYHRIERLNMKLPAAVLAFKLLKCVNLSKEERMLVLSGMNFTEKEKLYEQAKASLKKFLSDHDGIKRQTTMKLDAAFLAENEEALIAAGYQRRHGRWSSSSNGRKWDEIDQKVKQDEDKETIIQSEHWKQNEENDGVPSDQIHCRRKMNPCGSDGRPLLCHSCGSYRHLIAECPYSYEHQSAHVQGADENVLLTQSQKTNLTQLGIDARNSAVLDSACSSTVCGKKWMEDYKKSLNVDDQNKIIEMEGQKIFRFGGVVKLKSLGSYIIPIEMAGKKLSLKTDVVDSEIPLLMSKSSMKKARITINTDNDTAEILGVRVKLQSTSSGHYCIPVSQRSRPTTKEKPDSSNTNYEWKHVMITERVQNGTKQMSSMYRVTDQVTRREFCLDLNSLPPGTRLIRI